MKKHWDVCCEVSIKAKEYAVCKSNIPHTTLCKREFVFNPKNIPSLSCLKVIPVIMSEVTSESKFFICCWIKLQDVETVTWVARSPHVSYYESAAYLQLDLLKNKSRNWCNKSWDILTFCVPSMKQKTLDFLSNHSPVVKTCWDN